MFLTTGGVGHARSQHILPAVSVGAPRPSACRRVGPADAARLAKKLAIRTTWDAARAWVIPFELVMQAAQSLPGASERSIANQIRHGSVQVMWWHIRDGNLFRENKGSRAGPNHAAKGGPVRPEA